MVSLEYQCWSTSLYSRQECLEISGIFDKTDQKHLEDSALNIFRKLDVEIDSLSIEIVTGYCARSPNV